MASKARGRGDVRSFEVANFANHDDIGRLPEDRAQRDRKGHSDFRIHLHLVDPIHLIFDRLFDRDDLAVGFVDVVQAGVKGACLAGTGRASDKQNAVGQLDQTLERFLIVAEKSELGQTEHEARFVEHAHNDALAVIGRDD